MGPDPSFEVFNEDIEIKLKEIGHMIAGALPEGWGFNLLIFSFGKGGSTFYISNAQRADMIEAMKEFIKKNDRKN